MRFAPLPVVCLAFASVATSTLLCHTDKQPAPKYPIGKSKEPFAKVSGRVFKLNHNSTATYFAGTNAWWLTHLLENDDVDIAMQQIADTKYKIIRTWGFGDVNTIPDPGNVYFQLINSTGRYINYGADGLERLDYVVSKAEQLGLKLVIPFVNNWSDLGGMAAYSAVYGGDGTTFYTQENTTEAYKAYAKVLISRYANSSAIFAWELANEPRCRGCNTTVLTTWATEISQYIKSLDPFHMVTLGDEGFMAPSDGVGDGSYVYSGAEGVSWTANLKIPTLDYATMHLYPDSWGYNYTWGNTWIQQHDAVAAAMGKPVILEEYGVPPIANRTAVEAEWQATVFNGTVAADQIWQFGTYNMSVGTGPFDYNTIYYGTPDFEILGTSHSSMMLAKKVLGRHHY